VNLLPRPRAVRLDDATVGARPPAVRIDPTLPPEAYRLAISESSVDLVAGDESGAFYGAATLDQLARLHDGRLPCGEVEDAPAFPVRGVMLDVSRDRVPTMETLEALIERFAAWKLNHLQLYVEHTFAYADHGEVHAEASPFTPEEIRHLDAFCRARHVELAPNQNCLGHMNRWLAHDRYRHLALEPDGFVDPYGIRRPPMTLDPGAPGAFDLVRSLLTELLPVFTSRRVHVGLDEPWELPAERLEEYLAWIGRLRALPELADREMLVWGDVVAGHPDLLPDVPAGVTVVEWGYEDWWPFREHAAALAGAGVPFWVAPGTSSWLTVLGRVTNMRGSCLRAAEAGVRHGAAGFLVTDWGDQGHLQQWPVSEPGFAYAAAVAWDPEVNGDLDLAAALDAHAFDDPAGRLGRVLTSLGDVHRLVTPQFPNLSTLVFHLYFPQSVVGRGLTKGLRAEELGAVDAALAAARDELDAARPRRADGATVIEEVRWSVDLVDLLCRDARARLGGDGTLASVPRGEREEMAGVLAGLVERYRERWSVRNRPGGLADSVAWLENLRAAYLTGSPDPTWGGWPA
jgi:hypothetical protein